MNRLVIGLLLTAGISLLLVNCSSDKNSTEACLHETTLNLDKGNYDAVLASSCANAMQKGAAYFGKAGFDIKSVINNFSETGSISTSTTSSTGTKNDLNIYMTALVGKVTGTSLTYMDDAKSQYSSIPPSNSGYKDAQFYVSLVDAVKSLSLIKIVLPNILDANGDLNTACDGNSNGVPDDADATACALMVSAPTFTTSPPPVTAVTSCSTGTTTYATVTHSTALLFSSLTGTTVYDGLKIDITPIGTGTTVACIPTGTSTYYKLLYKLTAAGEYAPATTTADLCTASDGSQWPCPIAQNGQPLDLVAALNESLNSSLISLSSSITGTTGTDVQQAITDIQAQACCGCVTTPCPACTSNCTSLDVATYLQTNLQ